MSEANPLNLPLALGCVEYEMHVPAMALLMRRDGSPSDTRFPEAVSELVASALLVKARSLVEFLTRGANAKRITLENFGIPRRNDQVLKKFYVFVCNHSVHLDRKRASDPLVRRATTYQEALYVLRESANACNEIRKKGVRLSARRHRAPRSAAGTTGTAWYRVDVIARHDCSPHDMGLWAKTSFQRQRI